jgi:hypothetical protein
MSNGEAIISLLILAAVVVFFYANLRNPDS